MARHPLRTVLDHLRRLHDVAGAAQRSDRELLRAFATNKDQDAFAIVVTRHAPLVWGVCRRILGHHQDAEDALQATFLILARRAGSVRWQTSVGGWLHTVAQRLAVRARKQAEQRRIHECEASRTPPGDASLRELAAVVDEELRRLPAKYREPLLLHYLESATAEVAARQLGLSRGTFYNRLTRGRELLRERLSRQGLSLAAPLLAAALTGEAQAASRSLIQATISGGMGTVPERVAALAAEGLKAMSMIKLKIGLALGLLLGLSAGGVAMLTPLVSAPSLPQAERPVEPPQVEDKSALRVDRYGDPLPPGAIARLGALRFRVDTDEINRLAFAPDGKTIAVQGNRGLWLLDAISGKQIRRLDTSGALGPGIDIPFSPDGKQLIALCLAAEKDPVRQVVNLRHVVRVWETASGQKVRECEAKDTGGVGWSADGQPLATHVDKGEMCLRDLATGRERRFAAKDAQQFGRSTFGRTGLAAFDLKGRVHVWDLSNREERCVLKADGPFPRSLALSPDGRWLAALTQANAGTFFVNLWDTATGAGVHRVAAEQKYIDEVAFSPEGKMLATVGTQEIRLWDVKTGEERGRIQAGGWTRRTAAFSPDGKTLASAESMSRAVDLWDVASGRKKPGLAGHTDRPGRPEFSPDGKRVATGFAMDGTIFIWDSATGKPLFPIHRQSMARGCAYSADGRTLYACQGDNLLFLDAATGREMHVLKVEDPNRPNVRQSEMRLHLSDDRARLIVFSSEDRNREMLVTGWDAATRKQLFHRRRAEDAIGSVVSADARTLAAPLAGAGGPKGETMGKGPMYLEDLTNGEQRLTFPRFEGQTWPLAFSPDGRLLISNTLGPMPPPASKQWGDTLRFWETLTASELLVMPVPTNAGFTKAAFSPDGRLLALSAPSTEILLWDVRRREELRRFKDFGAQVTSLAFSPDNRRLVSAVSDSTLLVWDVGAPPSAPVEKLGTDGAAKAWAELADTDAKRSFRARWKLASAPEEAVPLLKEHLHPAKAVDPQRLRRLLADLDSEQFAGREKAQGELEKLADLAESALRQTLANKPSLEMRQRVQTILDRLRGPVTQPELLQALRAVAVLEDIGTPEARRLLQELAKGAPESRLTGEARASLGRMERRSASK